MESGLKNSSQCCWTAPAKKRIVALPMAAFAANVALDEPYFTGLRGDRHCFSRHSLDPGYNT